MDCIFCKIIDCEIPSYTIYEDDIVKVFLDVNPKSNGHMLIVPKVHTLDMDTIDQETLLHVIAVARKMRKILEEKLHIAGVTYAQNNGSVQDVKHFHLHVIPCYKESHAMLPVEEVYKTIKGIS